MFTTLQSFVIQKMKQGIYPFRLTADTMNRLYKITPIMYYFIKETRFRKSILQIRIKNFISIRHQIRTTLLFSIFQCIKSIQQSTSHKTHFGNIRLVTSSCTQFHPRIIMSRSISDKTFHEEITHHFLHFLRRIRCIYNLRTVCIIRIFPNMLHTCNSQVRERLSPLRNN